MADEGYNTHEELRSISGMGASKPTNTVLTHWVNLIDGLIERYRSDPDTEVAKLIEANRIAELYWNVKHDSDRNEMTARIPPLSPEEMNMLSGYDTNIDSISINGKRRSEIYGGRR